MYGTHKHYSLKDQVFLVNIDNLVRKDMDQMYSKEKSLILSLIQLDVKR